MSTPQPTREGLGRHCKLPQWGQSTFWHIFWAWKSQLINKKNDTCIFGNSATSRISCIPHGIARIRLKSGRILPKGGKVSMAYLHIINNSTPPYQQVKRQYITTGFWPATDTYHHHVIGTGRGYVTRHGMKVKWLSHTVSIVCWLFSRWLTTSLLRG